MAEDKKEPVFIIDPAITSELQKSEAKSGLLSNILFELERFDLKKSESDENKPIRLAFEVDYKNERYGGIFKQKTNLLPDEIMKRIAGTGGDDLVCQIVLARSNHLSLFGRPRDNRFDIGFDLIPKDKSQLPKDPVQMEKLMLRVERVKEIIWGCGTTKIVGEQEQPSFSQYLKMITRDGLLFGRHATEFIYEDQDSSNPSKLKAFRAADAGTIYKTSTFSLQDDSYRKQAMQELKRLYEEKVVQQKINVSNYLKGDYIYCQVITGEPRQFFTSDEMIMHNVYPTTNVEYGGYPLTPIDQAIHAITTHINITQHNKLYFQYGRAARGMLIVKSRGIDEKKLHQMRSQFQQTVNSVKHSHRMPVFGIGPDDDISWQAIDNSSRDMEFQFLSDSNARVILGAFQMSPDELPGYSHLSRGSNSQTLSESNNEYKLTAARDVGIRPLLTDTQDFINKNILPKIDEEVAKLFAIALVGLDKESAEKETAQLTQDMQVHATMNDVYDKVEKERLPKTLGGDLPLNQVFWQTVSPFLTVGQILEGFFDVKGASKDPRYMYVRDQFWLQYQQMIQQEIQMRIQMGMQSAMGQQPPQEGGAPQEEGQPLQQSEKDFTTANIELEALKKKWGV
jgi:hypothetical protein